MVNALGKQISSYFRPPLFLNAKLEAKLRELSEMKEKVSVVKHMKGKERI